MIEVVNSQLTIIAHNKVERLCKIKTKIGVVSMFSDDEPNKDTLLQKWMQTPTAQFLINNKVEEMQLVTVAPDWYNCTNDLWVVTCLHEQKLTEYYLKFTEEL